MVWGTTDPNSQGPSPDRWYQQCLERLLMPEKRSRQQVSSCPRLRKQQAVEDKTEMSWEGPLGSKRGLLFFRKPGLKTSGTLGRKRLHKLKQKLQLGRGGSPTYTDTRISQLKGIVCPSKQPQSFSRTMDWTSEAMRQKKSSLLWVACHRYFSREMKSWLTQTP